MLSTMSLSPRPLLLPSTSPFHHLKAHFGFHGPCSQNSVFITAHPNRNPRRLLAAVPKSDRSGGELPVIGEDSECCGELVPAKMLFASDHQLLETLGAFWEELKAVCLETGGQYYFLSYCCIFQASLWGYLAAAFARFKEPQRRAISIEVGMQNSSLGVVLATSHFTSPLFALAPAMSAVITNIMGSNQGFLWRYVDPSHGKKEPESDTK